MAATKTKWVRLGDYIEPCDERNGEGKYSIDNVRGVSIEKKLIYTKANMEGVSLHPYKVVRPKEFVYVTVTSRNGGKISLAMNNTQDAYIVSSSYEVFCCKCSKELLPEYLFMLLSRPEFDRYARFNSWGSARETFDWSELCQVKIPLPPLEVQQELVDIYYGLKALAEDNEAVIAPLTEACRALIADCKRKYAEEEVGKYIEPVDERNGEGKYSIDDVRGISIEKKLIYTKANMEGVSLHPYKVVRPKEFVYVTVTSRNGGKISLAMNNTQDAYIVSSSYEVFCCKSSKELLPEYLYMLLSRSEFDHYARFNSWGSARETFDWSELCRVKIPLPPLELQQSIVNLYHCIEEAKRIATEAKAQLRTLCPALVQYAKNA